MARIRRATRFIRDATPVELEFPDRGSPLRGGKDVVATGDKDAPVAISAGATVTLQLEVIEDCILDRLWMQSLENKLYELSIDGISINNNGHLNHVIGAQFAAHDAQGVPSLGVPVDARDVVNVTITNHGQAAANVLAWFSVL